MPATNFAIGDTLAGMVNIHTVMTKPFHILPDGEIPLIGTLTRTLSHKMSAADVIDSIAYCDALTRVEWRALIYFLFGNFTTGSAVKYISWRDEEGYISPFSCTIVRPRRGENYQVIEGGDIIELNMPINNLVLQSVTKSSNDTLTASQRLAYVDTTSGNVTITLPAANAVQANTVVSVQKVAAANTVSVQRAGSDTVNGGTSAITLTANHSRYDLISNGSNAWTTL